MDFDRAFLLSSEELCDLPDPDAPTQFVLDEASEVDTGDERAEVERAEVPAQETETGIGHEEEAARTYMSNRWHATIFDEEWDPVRMQGNGAKILYACWGFEAAPKTGRKHWHVYLRTKSRARMDTVKNIIECNSAHLEKCRGDEKANKDYCWKDGSTLRGERGEFKPEEGKGQGHRTDLDEAAEMVLAGASIKQVARTLPKTFVRNFRGLKALADEIKEVPVQRDVAVLVLWGPTGTGKTHRVRTAWPDCYVVQAGPHPWDSYSGQTTICFEEFVHQDWPINAMNQYLDKWKVELTARYYNRYAEWTRVVICANSPPTTFYQEMFASAPMLVDAFRRRITGACRLVEAREDQGGPSIEEITNSPPNPF